MADALRAAKKARQEQAKSKLKDKAEGPQANPGPKPALLTTEAQKREKELEALAIKQLVDEANRGNERASNLGATGWSDEKRKRINHRFLRTTLTSTERHNQEKDGPQARAQSQAHSSEQTKKELPVESEKDSTTAQQKRCSEDFP